MDQNTHFNREPPPQYFTRFQQFVAYIPPFVGLLRYESVGCYKDQLSPRAIDGNITFYKNPSKVVHKCYMRATLEGNSHFGVAYGSECYTSRHAGTTYHRYGEGSGCRDGRGGSWRISVYRVFDGKW